MMSCVSHQLSSKDGQFIAFIAIYRPFNQQDSIRYVNMFPNRNSDAINNRHTSQIKAILKVSYGEKVYANWKQ